MKKYSYAELRKIIDEVLPWLQEQNGYLNFATTNGEITIFHSESMGPTDKKLIATELGDIPLKFMLKEC